MEPGKFNQSLIAFLRDSTTPFHAVRAMSERLDQAGFIALDERAEWRIEPGKSYYVMRNGSSLVAFHAGHSEVTESGVRMLGAHTDSPCLRLKPNPVISQKGYLQLGVEVYGGALLNPWFDRDLSIAGRLTVLSEQGTMIDVLIDFGRPVAVIPSLAIHLDREANSARSVNPQKDLPALLMQVETGEESSFHSLLLDQVRIEHPDLEARAVLGFELGLYDVQPPALIGLRQEFIASARLDNLLSCFVGLQALLDADGSVPALLVCNDHEEVGSMSSEGAQGPFLATVLERWLGAQMLPRVLAGSMLISADNAHGVHPNFSDRHDGNHGPILNQGPVIKINNNQRYATNSRTSALYRRISEGLGLPVQTFVVRSDMACGSTIGPLTAGKLGVRTLDIGVPQLAMHSIRELAGTRDAHILYRVVRAFMETASLD